ncbi:HNH endonuclease [Bradyrhizobium ganzhouense]|uniref:HNH endonuclease n=1 Tax=Bradyrhizobium ganzhouense TaxID=1179767 RepID=UPI003CF914CB
MSDFIGYHKTEEWGPYFDRARKRRAKELKFFTGKRFRTETLVGNRIWIVTGRGSPKSYDLVCSGVMKELARSERPSQYSRSSHEDGTEITFQVDYLPDPIDITQYIWFQRLLSSQQNFSRGLNRISDVSIVASLNAIRSDENSIGSPITRDLAQIEADVSIDKTTRKALIDARLGQGRFRYDIEKRWEEGCAVINCKLRPLLRASHIKPWRASTNQERLDPANGLLLSAHLDALFDSGLISFRDDGVMLISSSIPPRDAANLQIPSGLRRRLMRTERQYLEYHRKTIFKH